MIDISNILEEIMTYITKQLDDDIIELNDYEISLETNEIDKDIIKHIYLYILSKLSYSYIVYFKNNINLCKIKINNIIISLEIKIIDDKYVLLINTEI